MLHIDVMDGHFVNNITLGAPVIASLRPKIDLDFDVHLMIEEPSRYIKDFVRAGADSVTVHVENEDIDTALGEISQHGLRAGISLKPKTDIKKVFPYLNRVGAVLVMTVEPGFGGQPFMEETLEKIISIRRECGARGLDINIRADGGIDEYTVKLAAAAGANAFVSGSAVFGAADRRGAIAALREAAELNYDLALSN